MRRAIFTLVFFLFLFNCHDPSSLLLLRCISSEGDNIFRKSECGKQMLIRVPTSHFPRFSLVDSQPHWKESRMKKKQDGYLFHVNIYALCRGKTKRYQGTDTPWLSWCSGTSAILSCILHMHVLNLVKNEMGEGEGRIPGLQWIARSPTWRERERESTWYGLIEGYRRNRTPISPFSRIITCLNPKKGRCRG